MIDIVRKSKTVTDHALFTEQQFAQVATVCKQQLKQYGSDFLYDDLFG